ncbi:MAG: peptidoglycan DD-metalloendopeptidase family protein [Caldithrix sp.]|nr:peptidoglycan DD-metalloendopeptidase family protein [Caldithrix sp.]
MPKNKNKSKYTSFVIVSDGKEEPKSFRLSNRLIRAALVVLIVLGVLIVSGAISYWKVASMALENNRLKEENYKLSKSLEKMNKINEDLNRIRQYGNKIRTSLSGYLSIENNPKDEDSSSLEKMDFEKIGLVKKRSIFRSIPSLMPIDGFLSRGFENDMFINKAHLGVDLVAATGTPIKASADGVVLFSGWTDDGGNVLIIRHGYGFISIYKHNESNLVSELERVSKGQVVALLGNTGKITSGAHLHFEVWKNGSPVNPLTYINEGRLN